MAAIAANRRHVFIGTVPISYAGFKVAGTAPGSVIIGGVGVAARLSGIFMMNLVPSV